MTIQEKFLSLYKEYEGLVRAKGQEPKEVEDMASGNDGERLRLCRQFRNYFAHVQDPGFLEPTEKMFGFLQQQVDARKVEGDIVKKHVMKPEACILTEVASVSDAWQMFSRRQASELPVYRKDGTWGMLHFTAVLGLSGKSKLKDCKTKKVLPVWCSPMDSFADIDIERLVLCTEDGTPDGKLLGRVMKK